GRPGGGGRGLDGAADAALSESAARSHRGAHLWPRMAARLRQAAALAVVAGRAGLPDGWGRRRLLRAGADRGGGGVRGGLADRSPARRGRRRARRRALSRRPCPPPLLPPPDPSRRRPIS